MFRVIQIALASAAVGSLVSPGAAQTSPADDAARAVSENSLESHWRALTHDSMEGRAPGTPGEQRAANYIATQFQRIGLSPGGDAGSYLQRFTVKARGNDVTALNVAGCIPGSDSSGESVVLGAHYDAYGIGRSVAGDSIYNGALDNASGTATIISVAEALVTSGAKPRRALCFVAFGAEERGLLGSKAYVAALEDATRVVGMLNIDGANIWGRTRDVAVLGDDLSTLGVAFRRAAAAESLSVTVHEKEVRQGFFSRSDQISFARAGIPALFFRRGNELVDGGMAAWEKHWADYYGSRYHKPSDEILEWHSVAGAAQQARVAVRMLFEVANASARPRWYESAPFRNTTLP